MYIHGIYTAYLWIFLDIPSFLNFAGGACCWSHWHSMRTRVWVIKSNLFHAPPWQLCEGKRLSTKGSTRLQPTSNLPPSVAGCGGDGSGGGGGVAGVFLFS